MLSKYKHVRLTIKEKLKISKKFEISHSKTAFEMNMELANQWLSILLKTMIKYTSFLATWIVKLLQNRREL